jgi:hypothetical protein
MTDFDGTQLSLAQAAYDAGDLGVRRRTRAIWRTGQLHLLRDQPRQNAPLASLITGTSPACAISFGSSNAAETAAAVWRTCISEVPC